MPQSSVLSPYCKFPKLGKYIHTSSQIWILEVVILLNLESRKERKYLKWHVFSMSCELTLFLNARHGLMQSRWPGDIILSLFQMLISRILKGVYLVSILPFHIYPFSVLTSCCSRRRSWSRNTFTFSKFDFYLDFDEIACNAHDLWWWLLLLLLHIINQVVESEKTAKWQYTRHCEELGTEIKKLREEVAVHKSHSLLNW